MLFQKAGYFSFKIFDKTIVFIGHSELNLQFLESEEAKQTLADVVMDINYWRKVLLRHLIDDVI